MNKTIFNLSYKKSITIIFSLAILVSFLSNSFYTNNLLELIFYIFRSTLFIGIYGVIYIIERKNLEFKETNKRIMGYMVILFGLNIIFSIFKISHILPNIFLTFSGFVCLWFIILFFLEILSEYKKNNIVIKIVDFNKKIGLAASNPIIKVLNRITSD